MAQRTSSSQVSRVNPWLSSSTPRLVCFPFGPFPHIIRNLGCAQVPLAVQEKCAVFGMRSPVRHTLYLGPIEIKDPPNRLVYRKG